MWYKECNLLNEMSWMQYNGSNIIVRYNDNAINSYRSWAQSCDFFHIIQDFLKGSISLTLSFFKQFFANLKHNFSLLSSNVSVSLNFPYKLCKYSLVSLSQQLFELFLNPDYFLLNMNKYTIREHSSITSSGFQQF